MINSPAFLNYFNANSMHYLSQNSLHYLHYFELLSIRKFAIKSILTAQKRNETQQKDVFPYYFHSQFSFVQLACKDCYLTRDHAKRTVKLASKGFDFISLK